MSTTTVLTPRLDAVDVESCAHRHRHVAADACTALDPFALFRNPPFTDADWARHSGWRRLLPRSGTSVLRVVAWYWPPLAVEAALSAVVVGYQAAARHHPDWPSLAHQDLITPLSLTAFLLGLLLVFRTNTAFGRWDEARKLLGGVIGESRTMARRIVAWSLRDAGGWRVDAPLPPTTAAALRWTAVAPVALAMRVAATPAERDAWASAVGDLLPRDDARQVVAAANPPAVVATQLGFLLASLPGLDGPLLAALDATLDTYTARCVGADRLRTQPTPCAYTRNTGRFMIVWLAFVPFALYERFRFATPVPAVVVAFFLLAVENIAAQLEQPFATLPMDVLIPAAVDSVTCLPAWHQARPATEVLHPLPKELLSS